MSGHVDDGTWVPLARPLIGQAADRATTWLTSERAHATIIGEETLWREAYAAYRALLASVPVDSHPGMWAGLASELVARCTGAPLNERQALLETCDALDEMQAATLAEKMRVVERIADDRNVEPWKLRLLLEPGTSHPWMFPRELWSSPVVARTLEAILAPFEWETAPPDASWLEEHGARGRIVDFLAGLRCFAAAGSDLDRQVEATASLVDRTSRDGRDVAIIEAQTFVTALTSHGLSESEVTRWRRRLLTLREAVVLVTSFHLYRRAESSLVMGEHLAESDLPAALGHLGRSANLYKRLSVAQMFPDLVLARWEHISRKVSELRADGQLRDRRRDQVLLVSTCNSPGDLERLLLSVRHELMSFAYGRAVHIVISDESREDVRRRNEEIIGDAARSGLSVSHWTLGRREAFLEGLNRELFQDGSFDVRELAGPRRPGEKAVPYGRVRNFLRLAGLHEARQRDLHDPIFTWLDQDNELGALVLTRAGRLAKRHAYDYFDQKSRIFDDPRVLVAGGGYTNDALEGVERFWVAWGVLHNTIGLAEHHSPDGTALFPREVDITRFRPWEQPETLDRLPREGEDVGRISDQFLLLLRTLMGAFRGKYDNQVQIYHPWTCGTVGEGEQLVEEVRPFAGMPGGNTSSRTEIASSSVPFLTVGGRGEDIFHLWQLEGRHGTGSVCLTHTPALHTRNVRGGRGDLMTEIIDSYNGRLFREPPYIWSALASAFGARTEAEGDVEARSLESIRALHTEAKARIAAVSGFAAALEPYLDESGELWWITRGRDDPQYATVLTTLRGMVRQFKDVEAYQREADAKLFGLEEIKELAHRFIDAWRRWESVVTHVAGGRRAAREEALPIGTRPFESYGSPPREPLRTQRRRPARGLVPEAPALVEPPADVPWQEAFNSSLLLFRRYEQGAAENESRPGWNEQVTRLRTIYEHYTVDAEPPPASVWTRLYRDALFVPGSAPFRALTAVLGDGFAGRNGDPGRELTEIAERYEVAEEVLRQAIPPAAHRRGRAPRAGSVRSGLAAGYLVS